MSSLSSLTAPLWLPLILVAALAADATESPSAKVAGIREYRHGQTFVTWKDAAEGEAGSGYRYSLYRSEKPITEENLSEAELCYHGVLNNSATQFGHAFKMQDRLDPSKPRAIAREGGEPLPMWSGIAVRTVKKEGKSYYAIVATDATWQKKLSKVVPGESATTEPVEEKVAPIQPIKFGDAKSRGSTNFTTGKEGLPLRVGLHGSQSNGGAADLRGDYYLYFGTPEMGWRDGLPGVFSILESRAPALHLFIRDSIENPQGSGAIETCWFGYFCVPVGATHSEPRAYPFTENRLAWIVDWVKHRYKVDANRVYSSGSSMGGMGSTQFSFRQPQTFAAVYPRVGRVRQSWLPAVGFDLPRSIHKARWSKPAPMFDGETNYFDRMDSVKWAREHHEDLPFYAWAFGRQDGVAPWQDQIDMVEALTASRHGFAFAWNNGNHGNGGAGQSEIAKYYSPAKFALGQSYPAFGNSSINANMGNGDRDDGDLVGGINLGFLWDRVVDEEGRWSVELANDLCKAEMTVDVTPRRCQKFRPKPGDKLKWESSAGAKGELTADRWGLVTIEKAVLKPGEKTTFTIKK